MKTRLIWLLVAGVAMTAGVTLAAPGGAQGPADVKAEKADKVMKAERADQAMKPDKAEQLKEASRTEIEAREREIKEDKAQGEATSAEMQARRDERKAIKESYREGREAGEAPAKGKKPWWKFWESDEA